MSRHGFRRAMFCAVRNGFFIDHSQLSNGARHINYRHLVMDSAFSIFWKSHARFIPSKRSLIYIYDGRMCRKQDPCLAQVHHIAGTPWALIHVSYPSSSSIFILQGVCGQLQEVCGFIAVRSYPPRVA